MTSIPFKPLLCIAAIALSACSDSDDKDPTQPSYISEFSTSFGQSSNNWQSGFADYPLGKEAEWQLTATPNKTFTLANNTNSQGYYLHSSNHSDDTQMYLTTKVSNLKPNTFYEAEFDVQIATNVNDQCGGIGGAPHAVTVKAGLSQQQPTTSLDRLKHHRLNLDFGQQVQGGLDGISLGDIASPELTNCDPGSDVYALKHLTNDAQKFEVTTDASGALWLTLLTDSGFEGITSIYFTAVKVKFTESSKSTSGFTETVDFSKTHRDVNAVFFDTPADRPFDWELTARPQTNVKDANGETITGYLLHSYNRSDDTGMLVYKPIKGLQPNTQYEAHFNVTMATNVNNQCFGIGGAPHAVAVKAGISNEKPMAILPNNDDHNRLNLDFGNNMQGSDNAVVLGDIGLETLADCDPGSQVYGLKHFDSKTLNKPVTFTTDNSGVLYFSVLTDSGFEGPTTILFTQAQVSFTKL